MSSRSRMLYMNESKSLEAESYGPKQQLQCATRDMELLGQLRQARVIVFDT